MVSRVTFFCDSKSIKYPVNNSELVNCLYIAKRNKKVKISKTIIICVLRVHIFTDLEVSFGTSVGKKTGSDSSYNCCWFS